MSYLRFSAIASAAALSLVLLVLFSGFVFHGKLHSFSASIEDTSLLNVEMSMSEVVSMFGQPYASTGISNGNTVYIWDLSDGLVWISFDSNSAVTSWQTRSQHLMTWSGLFGRAKSDSE